MRVSSFYLRTFFRTFVFTIGLAFSLTTSLPAQLFDAPSPGGSGSFLGSENTLIRGRVNSGRLSNRLMVVLTRPGDSATISWADVRGSGEFELIPRGPLRSLYELKVVEMPANRVIHIEHVSPTMGQTWVDVVIRKQKDSQPVAGWVTLQQLQQKVPKKARKEFARGQKSMAAKDYPQSIAHLEKALEIYPSYIDAHHQLGMAYFKQNDYPAAIESLRRALDIDPAHASSQYCLALALANIKQFAEAEIAAREAVRLSPGLPWAHYVLGLVLVGRNPDSTEAMAQFRQAAPMVPLARVGLAQLLARQGKPQEAVVELRSYLDSGTQLNREWAEAWMEKLRRQ